MKVQNRIYPGRKVYLPILLLVLALAAITADAQTADSVVDPTPVQTLALPAPTWARTIKSSVVALDQVIIFNRFGAVNPNGMIYALKQDVVAIDPATITKSDGTSLHGHYWQDEPYTNKSKAIGSNLFSEFKGAQYGIGPSSHKEVIPVNGAGGARRVAGDYLYRTQESFQSMAASGASSG